GRSHPQPLPACRSTGACRPGGSGSRVGSGLAPEITRPETQKGRPEYTGLPFWESWSASGVGNAARSAHLVGRCAPGCHVDPVRIGGYGAPAGCCRWTVRALKLITSLRPKAHKEIANLAGQTVYCAIITE